MSKITTIYDAIVTNMATLFPNKTRIKNPYSMSDNMAQFLYDGWGMKIGSAIPEEFEFSKLKVDRTFTIVLSRELITLDTDTDPLDTVSKAFLEDIYSVQNLFFAYDELGIEASIMRVELGDASEIQQVVVEKQSILYMEVSFIFNVIEDL